MLDILVILASVRTGRQSPKAAQFVLAELRKRESVRASLLDLKELHIPEFEERLRLLSDPADSIVALSKAVSSAEGVIIVTPEYNAGYPAVLKNAIDHLGLELKRKPVGIVSVSGGPFGGLNALAQLRLVLLQMGAIPAPVRLPILKVQENFQDDGTPNDPVYYKSASTFLDEYLWLVKAIAQAG